VDVAILQHGPRLRWRGVPAAPERTGLLSHGPVHPPIPDQKHAPLQVIDGNDERMSGVCPWWDAVKRSGRPI
jgi:hypothetical protein